MASIELQRNFSNSQFSDFSLTESDDDGSDRAGSDHFRTNGAQKGSQHKGGEVRQITPVEGVASNQTLSDINLLGSGKFGDVGGRASPRSLLRGNSNGSCETLHNGTSASPAVSPRTYGVGKRGGGYVDSVEKRSRV